ncbi:MAG: prepilin peptidase [Clostridia bacterium]|nr:prepilin peptidase [Clostridia bacterium]
MGVETFITICIYTMAAILGLCVGSFLNVVIYRLPRGMSLFRPGSHCPTCGYTIKWYDLIPVLAYILLGGRCRICRGKISSRYMLVEIANCLLWVLSVWVFWQQSPIYALAAAIISSVLICLFFVDLEHMIILNRFSITVAVAGVAVMLVDNTTVWYDHIIGMVAGLVVFMALYYGSIAVLHQEGMGLGDVKYAAAAGLALGWQRFILAMLVASVLAAVVMIVSNRVQKADKRTEHPFGPFLALGTLVALFAGDVVIDWYIGFLFSQLI